MAEYSKIIRGTFTSTGAAKFLSLPMVPDTIEIWNETKYATTSNHIAISAIGFAESAAGTAYATASNGTANVGVVLTSGGFSFVSAGTYQYGPTLTISGIVAATGVVTTTTPHGLSVGDAVLLYGTTGMLQIAGTTTTVTAVGSTTTFTIGNIPTSGFAANASAGFAKKLLYPDLYVPFVNTITAITTGTTTTISTSLNHSFVVGQEVFFTIPSTSYVNTTPVWGTTQLDSATYVRNNGVPQQAYITSITNANTFVVNVNSTGYGAFTYPTSAQAALGVTFPQVAAIGDSNFGFVLPPPLYPQPTGNTYTNTVYPKAITIPGAFLPNTRQGVIVGTGDGTTVLHVTSDVIAWRAIFPDAVELNV
jgi:hypothetical protein